MAQVKQIKLIRGSGSVRETREMEQWINTWLQENSGANVIDIRFYPVDYYGVSSLIGLIIFEPSNNEEAGGDINAHNHM